MDPEMYVVNLAFKNDKILYHFHLFPNFLSSFYNIILSVDYDFKQTYIFLDLMEMYCHKNYRKLQLENRNIARNYRIET